jgi:hypothetical protein
MNIRQYGVVDVLGVCIGAVLCTSTSLPGSMRPLFGRTQYLKCCCQLGSRGCESVDVLLGSRCFDLCRIVSATRFHVQRAWDCSP